MGVRHAPCANMANGGKGVSGITGIHDSGMKVLIRGNGVAASCSAHLLGLQGIAAALEAVGRPALPVVMLSDPALALIRDVFTQPDLFAGRPRIDRRVVAWGGADPVTMPHSATIVTGAELARALHAAPSVASTAVPDFTVHATSPLPSGSLRQFGERSAVATPARLRDPADATACWIESLESGWLFLIPSGGERAWLLCVGSALEDGLTHSRLIAPRIVLSDATPQGFDPSPRMATDVTGPDWIACGTPAIAFDPICGDGTAQAVREAILGAAVIAAIRDGGDRSALTAHYGAMLVAAMRRHLQLSAPFYRTGGQGDWWRAAHDALAEGHDWCTARLSALPDPRYALHGYTLIERERAA